MSAFEGGEKEAAGAEEGMEKLSLGEDIKMVDINAPVLVKYSPISGLPAEFCEYAATFQKELPWLRENAPEVLKPEQLVAGEEGDEGGASGEKESAEGGAEEGGGGRKEKNKIGAKIAKESDKEKKVQIVIARIQRQKRKFVTSVAGMETVPGLKLKDVAKLFGKKFASGAAVSDTATGGKEIVIQGDVNFDLVPLIIKEYKVHPRDIYFLEGTSLVRQGMREAIDSAMTIVGAAVFPLVM